MNLYEISKCMFFTLKTSNENIDISKIDMFNYNDIYAYPPFLRFKFKNLEKEDSIYKKIDNSLINFNGNIKWRLVRFKQSKNYLLLPEIFIEFIEDKSFYDKKIIKKRLASLSIDYYDIINLAISDIPNLAFFLNDILDSVNNS